MKLSTEKRDVVKSQEFETINYGVDTKNLTLLFKMLRTNLYADLYGSIVRELVSNVVDSHTEANKPHTLGEVEWVDANRGLGIDCQLIVRDFGVGLSPDRMKNIYGNYLSSTKRDSNDQIGGFGLGSKVPFAYSDSFFVKTTFNGVTTKYLCYIDSTELGAISILEQYESDLENQTEIIIPIKDQSDKSKFQAAINEQLAYFPYIKYVNLVPPPSKVLFENEDCVVLEKAPHDHVHIVLGTVAYKIDFPAIGIMDINTNHSDQQCVKNCGVGLKIPIGAIQPTMSREGLFWTDDAKRLVLEKLEKARRAIAKQLKNAIAQETDYARFFGIMATQGTDILPRQWKFARVDKHIKYKSATQGDLDFDSSKSEWFADHKIRSVVPNYGGNIRRTKGTSYNDDYVANIADKEELRDLPCYRLDTKLNPRTCVYLFKTHRNGFNVVQYQPDVDSTTGKPKPKNNDYSKATAHWRSNLTDFDSIVVPATIITNFEEQERLRREELKKRKLEGRFVAKSLRTGEGYGVGTTRSFCYTQYESKFERDSKATIVYGFQEDHEKLCDIASYMYASKAWQSRWDNTIWATRGQKDEDRVLFLKISKELAKQFALMPDAHYVDNVIALKTSLNGELSKITSAWKMKPFIHYFHILEFFSGINTDMQNKYGRLHQLIEDYSCESRSTGVTREPFIKASTEAGNLYQPMEIVWKEIVEYFKDVELLSTVNFAYNSEEHKRNSSDGNTVKYLRNYVAQNREAIIKYLTINGKAVDRQPGKSEPLVKADITSTQITMAQEELEEA